MSMEHTRVLVVDDDASARTALSAILRSKGGEVVLARDGGEALGVLETFRPDVVFADLRMPRMDGIELCRAMHELTPDLPVIVTTGFADLESAIRGLRAGAADYIVKPLSFEAVQISIERAISQRAGRIERAQLRRDVEDLHTATVAAMERRDETLEIVSHELRGPLGVVAMAARQLAALRTPDPAAEKLIETLERGVSRACKLVDDLLEDTRLRSGAFSVNLAVHPCETLLVDAAELRPLAVQKGIAFDVQPSSNDLVLCDRPRIAQVLMNLVSNAINFSPRSGRIIVSAEARPPWVLFAVSDEGPGIPPDAIDQVFDRFWQTKKGAHGGLGLGLHVAREIVRAHSGEIWAESTVGFGSTFFFTIPVAPEHCLV
jgi:signal transduction histidine kinase